MYLVQKLKQFERNIIFLRWEDSAEYGKLYYVGRDFIDFEILDINTLEYTERVIINSSLINEITVGGAEINRVILEFSSKLPVHKK